MMATEATVPWEAFDDTHPDHAWWVTGGHECLAGDTCQIHPSLVKCCSVTYPADAIACDTCGRWLHEVPED